MLGKTDSGKDVIEWLISLTGHSGAALPLLFWLGAVLVSSSSFWSFANSFSSSNAFSWRTATIRSLFSCLILSSLLLFSLFTLSNLSLFSLSILTSSSLFFLKASFTFPSWTSRNVFISWLLWPRRRSEEEVFRNKFLISASRPRRWLLSRLLDLCPSTLVELLSSLSRLLPVVLPLLLELLPPLAELELPLLLCLPLLSLSSVRMMLSTASRALDLVYAYCAKVKYPISLTYPYWAYPGSSTKQPSCSSLFLILSFLARCLFTLRCQIRWTTISRREELWSLSSSWIPSQNIEQLNSQTESLQTVARRRHSYFLALVPKLLEPRQQNSKCGHHQKIWYIQDNAEPDPRAWRSCFWK